MNTTSEDKLTIAELAAYLPYNLEVDSIMSPGHFGRVTVEGLEKGSLHVRTENGDRYQPYYFAIKPILRPLSDLTKEIEHGGERFVPMERLRDFVRTIQEDQYLHNLNFAINHSGIPYIIALEAPLSLAKYLFQWHFDIYNLLDRGLAVAKE